MKDPYEVLGVPHGASDEQIKKPIASLPASIIRTTMPITPLPISRRKK